ncbi:cyclic nucleotide-binding domain-containing protein [candidate division KSB1 bacterium]|nr:cyclic nucleotide-binding domain-containing protein [candidate division KSB1 bacterium]
MERILKLDRSKIISIINRLDFFDKFSIIEKHKILAFHTQFFLYHPGEIIITEGSYDSSFYILLDGSAEVLKTANPIPLDEIQPGDFFGEISFLTNAPRTANVIASSQSIIIRIDNRMLNRLDAQIREKIKDNIINKLVRCLIHMNEEYAA